MKKQSADALALWLLHTYPGLFRAIAQHAAHRVGLGDISDIFSSIGSGLSDVGSAIGSGLSDAVSGVGDWLSNTGNVQSLTDLASNYFKGQAASTQANAQLQMQSNILNTQLQRAQAGLSPAPIAYSNGVPVYQSVPGQSIPPAIYQQGAVSIPGTANYAYPINNASLSALQPSIMQRYGTAIAVAAAAAFALVIFKRR